MSKQVIKSSENIYFSECDLLTEIERKTVVLLEFTDMMNKKISFRYNTAKQN